jgi:hypothetical protein
MPELSSRSRGVPGETRGLPHADGSTVRLPLRRDEPIATCATRPRSVRTRGCCEGADAHAQDGHERDDCERRAAGAEA